MTKFYIGSKGGGKGGGSQRTPVEDKDSLRSRAYAKLIDVVSEGQIGGLVNGLKSIYLDDVPLQNTDGSYNFEDVAVEFKDGSIGQSALSNMDGVDSTQSINVALKYNIPAVRTINSPEADYARVSIAVGQLSKQNTSNGDVHGTSVSHLIEYRANGGAWQTVKTDVIEGKTMSGYERSVTFKLAGSAPWDVRITRTTADSTSQALQNASKWSTLTSVIADKFRFPGTALLGMQINAEQFSNIPTRAYHLKGLVIKVPANYDPVTRAYSGAWNGTFKMAWTDNPVWCLYDLLTNERYGLGTRIDAGMIDKWELYQIAQYCDQLVPDGHGGMEPRFSCNLYLQTRAEAYKFIQDMAAIFRGISYWASGSIAVKSDMSSPVRYQFNNSNVENGVFERAGSNIQTRHNVALVTWNDPADMGRQKIEYVEDFDAIQKMGYVSETEVAAFGCTSQGQAHRLGEWLLYTEQYESEIVSFTAGADGAIPLPSDVIQISDVYRAGERRGGRVLAGSTKTSVKLDAPVTLATGKTYTLSTIDVDGGFQSATVTTGAGSRATLAVTPFAKDIAENATWILSDATLAPEMFKVIGVDEVENGKYKISCLSHNPSKYGYIEREQALTAPQTSNLQDQKPDVSDVVVTEVTATDKNDIPINKLNISWKPANAASTAFFVEYRTDSGAWQRTPTSSQYFAEISPVAENVTYQIRVVAGNRLLGAWANNPQTITYTPEAYSVPNITNLVMATAWATGQNVTIKWDVVNAKAYEVQVLEGATVRRIIKATESTYTYTAQDYMADGCNTRSLTFKVRAISSNGRTGTWSQVIATNAQICGLQGILVEGATEQAFFEYAKPADADFAGVIIWVGTTANFTPSDASKVYDGNDTVITLSKLTNGTKFTAGVTYYLRCAGYDTFGKDALAVSASVAFSVYSVTQMVTDLQATQLNQDLRTEIDKISGTGAGSVSARVENEATQRANADSANANAIQTVQTTVNGHTSSIQTQAQSINGLSAQYTVKIDSGGKVSGYGLASTPVNGAPTSSFIVNADKFGIGSSSTGNLMPFVVDTERGVIGMSGQVLIDGTLTTNKLLVGNTSNLIPNSDFATGDATNWRLYEGADKISFVQMAGAPTKYVCRFASGAESVSMFTHVNSYDMAGADKDGIVVNAGEQYSVSIDALKSSTLTTGTRIRVEAYFYKTDGTYNTNVTSITLTSSITTAWATYAGSFTVPVGAVRCWLYVIMDLSPTAGDFYWTNLTCRPMIGDALIVDGGIRARHIGANEVTADKINVTQLSAINSNLGSINGGSININNRFLVSANGTTTIQSASTGARVVMTNSLIQVFDGNNVLRVKLGVW